MRQNDEKEKTKIWQILLLGSSFLIVLIAGFFVVTLVMKNPLEGHWSSKDQGYYLEIEDTEEAGNEMEVKVKIRDVQVEVDLYYELDKRAKVITLKADPISYTDAAADTNGVVTAQEIQAQLEEFVVSFEYSLDHDTLTLTEREFGQQFIFTRVK